MAVRFTLTGRKQWYVTTNGVTWWPITERQAEHAVNVHGALLIVS